MKKILFPVLVLFISIITPAQKNNEPGKWKTWLISSGKDFRIAQPAVNLKNEIAAVINIQQNMNEELKKDIIFWNAGAAGYRWQEVITKLWSIDTSIKGVLANLLVSVATYDAMVAAWNSKEAYKVKRPFEADKRVKLLTIAPTSPSYPCEYSVAAGASATVIAHFYPHMKDSVLKMAERLMKARVAAGVAYPSDTKAGYDLGKKIAELEIEKTKSYSPAPWNGKMPPGPGLWSGKNPMFPNAAGSKTFVLSRPDQFRPAPPPDFAKDMAELKNFKQNFRSQSNAFYYATTFFGGSDDLLNKKIFERNLHLNTPETSRMYAIAAIATYDGFIACWDAKYAYWGIRPDQYDTTYHPLLPTPPFPGYPSGHAVMSGMMKEVYSYFFPEEKALFQKRAKDGAESRFHAGIHFRSDNDAGLELGRQVAEAVLARVIKMQTED